MESFAITSATCRPASGSRNSSNMLNADDTTSGGLFRANAVGAGSRWDAGGPRTDGSSTPFATRRELSVPDRKPHHTLLLGCQRLPNSARKQIDLPTVVSIPATHVADTGKGTGRVG